MKINSTRWTTAVGGVLGLGCAYLFSSIPNPALVVDYSCVGKEPVVSLYGEGLPRDRFVEVSLIDIESGSKSVKGSNRLRTNKTGKLGEKLLFEDASVGTLFRLEVAGKYSFDDSFPLTVIGIMLRGKAEEVRTIATVDGRIPEYVCRRERF